MRKNYKMELCEAHIVEALDSDHASWEKGNGDLRADAIVRFDEDVTTLNAVSSLVPAGTFGRVSRIDSEGDASVVLPSLGCVAWIPKRAFSYLSILQQAKGKGDDDI